MAPLHPSPGPHDEAQALLPWYVTGALEPAERAQVEAHLAGCAQCQSDLAFERQLRADIASLPLEAERGWSKLYGRLQGIDEAGRGKARWPSRMRALVRAIGEPAWLGWAVAAPAWVIAGFWALAALTPAATGPYRVLGAPPANSTGNVIVVFRPDTQERALSQTLTRIDGRIVDGPTTTGAYVVRVPEASRQAALADLRRHPDVTLAEPIDGAPP